MQVINLWALFVVAHSIGLTGTTTVLASSSSSYQGQLCANQHARAAGRSIIGRTPATSTLNRRGRRDPVLWCAPFSRTYVAITVTRSVAPTAVMTLLHNALFNIQAHLARAGDGLVPNGLYILDWRTSGNECELYVSNSNNHQQTWGVVGAALSAVSDYMLSNNVMGEAEFTIYDGGNEVGQGTIDVLPIRGG